jgi:ubiquinone/menaquinone biosynthesis C-methylase UbiE
VLNLQRFVGPRVVPDQRTAVVEGRRGSLDFHYSLGTPESYVFTADIYAYMENRHPDRHLGWWRFALPPGRGRGTIDMDFEQIGPDSLQVTVGRARLSSIDGWFNPDYAFDPLGDLQFVIRDASFDIVRNEPALLKFIDRDILRSFYERQYATKGYTVPDEAPFLHELHRYKLGRLEELFARYIPGGRVVDVGCGRSLFTELEDKNLGGPFPFTVCAGDLNFDSVHERAVQIPHQQWAVFDAAAIPFQDEQFDALFAGEVIEHVTDVRETLQEWRRVLKPGGIAIITTPNKERLVALADGLECPYSRDHLSELSYRELTHELLPATGFEFVEQSCLYLELWLKNLFNGQRVMDFLQRQGNTMQHVDTMRRLFPLGRWFPRVSMALVVVARRK